MLKGREGHRHSALPFYDGDERFHERCVERARRELEDWAEDWAVARATQRLRPLGQPPLRKIE